MLSYPPILVYDIEKRIIPVLNFLEELGCVDPVQVVVSRPSLLGLDASTSLPTIVDYLRSTNEYTDEQILEIVEKSI